MEAMRESWTDDRLDDLSHRVEELGRRTDDGFNSLRTEMNARFEAHESRSDARFDAMQRMMLQLWAGMMFTIIAGFATLLATQL
jgi:hypothetical protein